MSTYAWRCNKCARKIEKESQPDVSGCPEGGQHEWQRPTKAGPLDRASLEIYDRQFDGIDHLHRYPAMLPYVGPRYLSPGHAKVLLLGESNYLPNESTAHKDAEKWYSGTQNQLSDEEVEWVHNRHLLQGDWKPPGHKIYREIDACVAEATGPGCGEGGRAMNHVAYMNAFQRPAVGEGASLTRCCTPKDEAIATDVVRKVVSILRPAAVIFVSKFAWDKLSRGVDNGSSVRYDFTSHPADHFHWRRRGYQNGRQKFIALLKMSLHPQ